MITGRALNIFAGIQFVLYMSNDTENIKRSAGESANTLAKSANRVVKEIIVHATQPGASEYVPECYYVAGASQNSTGWIASLNIDEKNVLKVVACLT